MGRLFKQLLSTVLVVIFGLGLIIFPVKAAEPGVNIGAQHGQFQQAVDLVGNGWVVFMATPGDCSFIEQAANSQANIIVRGHYPGQNYSGEAARNWAISWAYTLANMKGKNKIYFMPLNEPNQEGSGDYQDPGTVVNYTNQLIEQFNNLGIRGSKVYLLSPMLNATHGNIAGYVSQLGGGFFNRFDGVSINLYDFEDNPGQVFQRAKSKVPMENASGFGAILNLYGVPGKPVYGVEAGVVKVDEGVVYRDEFLKPFVQKAQTGALGSVMFAPFSYDPEHEEPWNIFTSATAGIYRKGTRTPEPVAAGQKTAQELIDDAKSKGINLVSCGSNSCGLAVSSEYCTTYASDTGNLFQPRIKREANDLSVSMSDPVRLQQKDDLNPPETGPRDVTRGAFLERFGGVTLPYVRYLANYLGGDLIFNNSVAKPSVLSQLLTQEIQDDRRAAYQYFCRVGVYCNGSNNDPDRCPNSADECSIITPEGKIKITRIPTKPLKRHYRDKPRQIYDSALAEWKQKPLSKYWYQIPQFSNPTVLVEDAVSVAACPNFEEQDSTVNMRVPWVSALKDISEVYNQLIRPADLRQILGQQPGAGDAKLASSKLFSPNNSKPTRLAIADSGQTQAKDGNACAAFNNIFSLTITPDIQGGADTPNHQVNRPLPQTYNVCWTIEAKTNDPNYNYADWTYQVTVKYKDQVVATTGYAMGGNNMFNRPSGQITRLRCENSDRRGPVLLSGVTDKSKIQVSVQVLNGRCSGPLCGQCDPRMFLGSGGPGRPASCQPPGIPLHRGDPQPGQPVPVEVDGHLRFRGPTRNLKCSDWQQIGPDEWKCVSESAVTGYNVNDPLWLYFKFPYLETIYRNLASTENGVWRRLVPKSQLSKVAANWNYAGASGVNYCVSVYDDVLRGHFLSQGNTPAEVNQFNTSVIDNAALAPYTYGVDKNSQPRAFDRLPPPQDKQENYAQCALGQTTTGLKVYPEKIGGVMNALEDVANCIVAQRPGECVF